jgi:hypothetical protein
MIASICCVISGINKTINPAARHNKKKYTTITPTLRGNPTRLNQFTIGRMAVPNTMATKRRKTIWRKRYSKKNNINTATIDSVAYTTWRLLSGGFNSICLPISLRSRSFRKSSRMVSKCVYLARADHKYQIGSTLPAKYRPVRPIDQLGGFLSGYSDFPT